MEATPASSSFIAAINGVLQTSKGRLKEHFEMADPKRTGMIAPGKLPEILQKLGLSLSEADALVAQRLFEEGPDGQLDYIEFLQRYQSRLVTKADLGITTRRASQKLEVKRRQSLVQVSHAVKHGVVVEDAGVDIDLKMQGNLQHYSVAAMQKREAKTGWGKPQKEKTADSLDTQNSIAAQAEFHRFAC